MKKSFDYRGYKITLTGDFGMCWDLWADSHSPEGESFEVPEVGCEAEDVSQLIAEAKKVMDENIYDNDDDDDDLELE